MVTEPPSNEELEIKLFKESCLKLLRSSPTDLDAHLAKVKVSVPIPDTNSFLHCYLIAHDASLRPRVVDLAEWLASKCIDYVIPRSEIEAAVAKQAQTNSTKAWADLNRKARKLFVEQKKTGEGGEMLLYVLAETYLRLPQILCKMPLKTSSEVHYHGIDGIHAMPDESGRLALYWGESKFHADVIGAIKNCLESLGPFLLDQGSSGESRERDLELIRDNLDLNDAKLEEALQGYLDPNNVNFLKVENRGICLVGFDCTHYPTEPNAKQQEDVKKEIEEALKDWMAAFGKQIKENKVHSFNLEVFCIPFPNVQIFRDEFLARIK